MRPDTSARTRTLSVLLAGILCCALGTLFVRPATARADTLDELQEAQEQVQQSNEDYEAANQRVEEIQAQIDENEDRIVQIEDRLPDARQRAASSMRTLYKMQQGSGGLVELLLSADDFYDLIYTVQYLDTIQAHSNDALDELLALQSDLETTRANLASQMEEATEQQAAAEEALEKANAARATLEEKIAAQAAAEEAERKAALEAAQKDEGTSFTTESGNEAAVEVPSSSESSGNVSNVEWSSDKESFVSEWTSRIDAYLAGSPLAGQGKTFAEAAWEYSVDPRFSPAIAMVESSLGRYCFLPYNAWGWGSSSWSSWEEAIWDHVAGLASGYGGQLTYAGAKKYCPSNADFWYTTVLANMERI